MKTLLSLFDYNGTWSKPFRDAGWNVIQQDLKLGQDFFEDTIVDAIADYVDGNPVHGILAAVPCTDFAGHLNLSQSDISRLDFIRSKNGNNVTADERAFIIKCNAYTKKTGLWGNFNSNLKINRIEPVSGGPFGNPFISLGGKSEKTKEIRSVTPKGFAQAFCDAQLCKEISFTRQLRLAI